MERQETVSTDFLLQTLEPDYKVLLVGDANMSPFELVERYGAINYYERNEIPGIVWLKRIADRFDHSVWLNPEEPRFWGSPSIQMITKLFPMFPLTVEGLSQSVKKLIVNK